MGMRSGLGSLQVVDETDLVAGHSTLMVRTAQNRSGDGTIDVDCFDCFAAPCPTDAVADTRCRQVTFDHGGSKIDDAVNVHATPGQRRGTIFLDARTVRRGPLDGRREASWIAELTRGRGLGKVKLVEFLEGRRLEGGRAGESARAGAGMGWEEGWEPEGAVVLRLRAQEAKGDAR
jgi:hypothetical protein